MYLWSIFHSRIDLFFGFLLFGNFGRRRRSSNCILRSSAASSDFNCFSSSSLWHRYRRFARLPDFGGKAQTPAGASAFRGCSKCFERLKRHLAVSLRTQESSVYRIGKTPFKLQVAPSGASSLFRCKVTPLNTVSDRGLNRTMVAYQYNMQPLVEMWIQSFHYSNGLWFKRWKTWMHENREIQTLIKRIYLILVNTNIEADKTMVVW